MIKETQIEESLIVKLSDLKYSHRSDIRDKQALEGNFREKFQALNRVNLTDSEFARRHYQSRRFWSFKTTERN
jgi:type I restriction enzyme R subunit